ncbi:hypothetical protein Ahy_B09g098319 [Arachis hypogaea]|uniref:F-box domain-containing protein n=1 Tax=Arachis hypogaea TaxID=3818 RepID=A0A444XQZ8_ARAHY|nr:hypothetical protein Ahy_B09g098319 [Arachis hypogaea]
MSHNTELISSSAKAIERHDALLTKILVRLPLRDVMAFKRVSKRWLSLISDPYFSRCRTTVQGTRFSNLILDPDFIDPQYRELTFFYFKRVKDDLPPLPPRPQDLNVGGPVYLTLPELNSKEAYNGYGYILTPTCGYMNLVEFDFEFCMRVFRLKEDDYSSSSIQHLIKDGHEDEMALLLQKDGKVIALRLKDYTIVMCLTLT